MGKSTDKNNASPDRTNSRRKFFQRSAILTGGTLLPFGLTSFTKSKPEFISTEKLTSMSNNTSQSIIGPYGPWLAAQRKDGPGEWSFRHPVHDEPAQWRRNVLHKVKSLIAKPDSMKDFQPEVRVTRKYTYDGLDIEELEWSWPYGHPTQAILLKPQGATGPLPAILGLHDHGGNKYFGRRKITKTNDEQHPMMIDHQEQYYEGRAWANEIAKKGYVVLVHDVFTFASRRVRYDELEEIPWGETSTRRKSDIDPENPENIKTYNQWAAGHEHVMAKSLFSGGTTWPGMTLLEDQAALSVLADREDVDEKRIGTAGLSGGGLRSVYLAGIDERVACVVCVGFMSTWDDFLLHKSFTHTWMAYTPVLPAYLEFPEILTLRMPAPTMVLNDSEDGLYTLPEMKKAVRILEENFKKAGAPEKLSCRFYPGPHKFDIPMQEDAFDWFDQWLLK